MPYTRREFNRLLLGALAGVAACDTMVCSLGCAARQLIPGNRGSARVLADLHVHVAINDWNRKTPLGVAYPAVASFAETFANKTRIDWAQCHRAGIDLMCAAHFNVFDEWLSMPTDPSPQASAHTYQMLDHLEDMLRGPAAPYARLARNKDELQRLLNIPKSDPEFRVAVVHTLEGGHALGGDIHALEPLAKRGVAMITLTHFFNKGIASAANAYPYFPDANSEWPHQGLSDFGREVIKEMERQGIIVDAVHATTTAMADILASVSKPIVTSHSSARTLGDHPYSLLDEHIQEISANRGIIGVIIDPYLLSNYSSAHHAETKGTLRDIVRTVRHVVKITGSHKHVGIGSDFAGFITGPIEMVRLSQIGRLHNMLVEEFGDQQIAEDIMANNTIDFLLENWQPGA